MKNVNNVTKEELLKNYKVKPLGKEQLIISADRLTRFKFTETKYLRVFSDIITGNLIQPKLKKTDIDNIDYKEITSIAEFIINYSLKELGIEIINSGKINTEIKKYEMSTFKLDSNIQKFLNNNINYDGIIELTRYSDVKNLQWLNSLAEDSDRIAMRQAHSLRFPLSAVLICEGITEETLLPEFAKILNFDFDKYGIYVVSAGGKNQVVKTFYKMSEYLKIPIFILLDNDAEENRKEIQPRLREIDKIHIIKKGEFEDIIPVHLLEKTLNYATANISFAGMEPIADGETVEFLTDFFKHRGMHEFKKAEFATMVKKNITNINDISDEIKEIIQELIKITHTKIN